MYERLDKCPLCNSGHLNNFMICKDFSVSQESFAIVQCKKCELKFTNPRPEKESLPQYYKSANYISHTDKGNSLINVAYKVARYFTIRNKVKFISQFHQKGNLLDFGCGTGAFILNAKQKGWNVLGVEPSDDARNNIDKKFQPFIFSSVKEIKLKKYFHVITLWHVLEHVADLAETLKKLRKLLAPGGTIIIAVPNCDSYDAQHYKEFWAAYDVPRHLYHFTPKTMKELLLSRKLKLQKIIPMPLDAYYVSLLSEKYRANSNNYLSAIKTGYKSNKWAKANNNNFSSLIYIAESI